MIKSFIIVVMMVLGFSIQAIASVEVDLKLLTEKTGLCDAELDTGNKGRYCDDLVEYSDFLFKGNTPAYFNYHIENGDLNETNIKNFGDAIGHFNKVLKRILEHE